WAVMMASIALFFCFAAPCCPTFISPTSASYPREGITSDQVKVTTPALANGPPLAMTRGSRSPLEVAALVMGLSRFPFRPIQVAVRAQAPSPSPAGSLRRFRQEWIPPSSLAGSAPLLDLWPGERR